VASQIVSWLEILDYVGRRREMEEWSSVHIGSPVWQKDTAGQVTMSYVFQAFIS
jgi:hypothetical protein